MEGESAIDPDGDIKISFGYQCNLQAGTPSENSGDCEFVTGSKLQKTSSFSCLSGAALSANATLANTNICNGLIGSEILPSLDSPKSFRKVPSSPALSKFDVLSPTLQSSMLNVCCNSSSPSSPEFDSYMFKPASDPPGNEGFLSTMEIQVAGGAAGEDRVQAVCSEENGWLFCAIYDGFNGRDAADFLAGTLYESIVHYAKLLDWESNQNLLKSLDDDDENTSGRTGLASNGHPNGLVSNKIQKNGDRVDRSSDSFRHGILDCLNRALAQSEIEFLRMVEQEMEERPDLVSVGSCVLVVLLVGKDLYVMNLGDSRAVLATYGGSDVEDNLNAVQLTEDHTIENDAEKARVISEHPDDRTTVFAGKVKGKLKVTRALGVGYLKKKILNEALMGILRVRNLISPPYVSTDPSMRMHRISRLDHFVIIASDGLFDFFSNEEAVKLVNCHILSNPSGDPAKFLLEQLVARAADRAGFTMEELMNIPAGRRRKYHDDVTVIIILLGTTNQRTSKASTTIRL